MFIITKAIIYDKLGLLGSTENTTRPNLYQAQRQWNHKLSRLVASYLFQVFALKITVGQLDSEKQPTGNVSLLSPWTTTNLLI